MTAQDVDQVGGPIRYAIVNDPSGFWEIDERTGVITSNTIILWNTNDTGRYVFHTMMDRHTLINTCKIKIASPLIQALPSVAYLYYLKL